MTGDEIREMVTVGLVLVAALMCFAAGVGLLRFPDVLSRLHAATKPQILGLMAVAAAIAVNNATIGTFALLTAIIIFQGLTAPITAHMVARAAYRSDHLRRDFLIRDELSESIDRVDEDNAGSPATAPRDTPD
ncbi:monovalent cation/H(+) antiporter subunit G [Mycetocola sp. 2940]|uniref:monovalent cation/H(+) antiporter subunit G n=1 Tax=Mycetocola sp. 2940 TaxID=3156452 RepID=UPI00339830CE